MVRQQAFADPAAQMCVTHDDRQDMTWGVKNRKSRVLQHGSQDPCIGGLPETLFRMCPHVPDRGQCARSQMRAKRCGEDEAVSYAADRIDEGHGAADIAAHHAERLGQGAFYHAETM